MLYTIMHECRWGWNFFPLSRKKHAPFLERINLFFIFLYRNSVLQMCFHLVCACVATCKYSCCKMKRHSMDNMDPDMANRMEAWLIWPSVNDCSKKEELNQRFGSWKCYPTHIFLKKYINWFNIWISSMLINSASCFSPREELSWSYIFIHSYMTCVVRAVWLSGHFICSLIWVTRNH